MKKVILGVIALGSVHCGGVNAGTMGPLANEYHWNGLYLGANAGYWWSQKNTVNTVGSSNFINPLFPLGTSEISNALASIGTNRFSSDISGFIGGGQAGYNYQVREKLVVGIDADIDGLTQSQSSIVSRIIPVANFSETYTSTLTVKKRINWLGTMRGKLGLLLHPSLLVYGVGGFAYGGVSLNELFIASESLGSLSYPTVVAKNNLSKTRAGWIAGAGIEWMFKSQWSAKIEYAYYDLGTLNSSIVLNQINNLGVTPTLWGSASIHSSMKFVAEAVRIGLNYHFA